MQEDFLHFIWLHQNYQPQILKTTIGEPLRIISPGHHNHLAGPDFSNATIEWAGLRWTGDIEIHVRASDWYQHQHQNDPHYQSVILHVVWEEDRPVFTNQGLRIPCLELSGRVPPAMLDRYQKLRHALYPIPCQHLIQDCPDLHLRSWLDAVFLERIAEKSQHLQTQLPALRGDLDQLFWQQMAYAMGLTSNGQTLQQLARSLDWRLLLRYRDRLPYLEALLFGQAGLLQEPEGPYHRQLAQTYLALQRKHVPLGPQMIRWKFGRIRPSSSLWLKMAQLAALVHSNRLQLDFFLRHQRLSDLIQYLSIPLSPFWQQHYSFEQLRPRPQERLSEALAQTLLINAVFPFLWLVAERQARPALRQQIISWAEQLPPEQNRITRRWKDIGVECKNGLDSQALIQLERGYCQKLACTRCRIGKWIMTGTNAPDPILAAAPKSGQKE